MNKNQIKLDKINIIHLKTKNKVIVMKISKNKYKTILK